MNPRVYDSVTPERCKVGKSFPINNSVKTYKQELVPNAESLQSSAIPVMCKEKKFKRLRYVEAYPVTLCPREWGRPAGGSQEIRNVTPTQRKKIISQLCLAHAKECLMTHRWPGLSLEKRRRGLCGISGHWEVLLSSRKLSFRGGVSRAKKHTRRLDAICAGGKTGGGRKPDLYEGVRHDLIRKEQRKS